MQFQLLFAVVYSFALLSRFDLSFSPSPNVDDVYIRIHRERKRGEPMMMRVVKFYSAFDFIFEAFLKFVQSIWKRKNIAKKEKTKQHTHTML